MKGARFLYKLIFLFIFCIWLLELEIDLSLLFIPFESINRGLRRVKFISLKNDVLKSSEETSDEILYPCRIVVCFSPPVFFWIQTCWTVSL
jgi:hypothetical protein